MNINNKLWDAAIIAAVSQNCSRKFSYMYVQITESALSKKRFFNLL